MKRKAECVSHGDIQKRYEELLSQRDERLRVINTIGIMVSSSKKKRPRISQQDDENLPLDVRVKIALSQGKTKVCIKIWGVFMEKPLRDIRGEESRYDGFTIKFK
jgi:hypothetical protein